MLAREEADTERTLAEVSGKKSARGKSSAPAPRASVARPAEELTQLIEELSEQMRGAAAELHFELAARLRDEISELKKELRDMLAAGWGRRPMESPGAFDPRLAPHRRRRARLHPLRLPGGGAQAARADLQGVGAVDALLHLHGGAVRPVDVLVASRR